MQRILLPDPTLSSISLPPPNTHTSSAKGKREAQAQADSKGARGTGGGGGGRGGTTFDLQPHFRDTVPKFGCSYPRVQAPGKGFGGAGGVVADGGERAGGESGGRVGGMSQAVGREISRPWGWHGDKDKTKTVILKPLSHDRQVA